MNVRRLALAVLTDVTDGGRLCQPPASSRRRPAFRRRTRAFSPRWCTGRSSGCSTSTMCWRPMRPAGRRRPVRGILRLGACELLFLRTPPHAAVSEYVSLCRALGKGGAAGFVNAVLRPRRPRARHAAPAARGAGRAAVHPVQPSAVGWCACGSGSWAGRRRSACSPARRCRSACARSTRRRPRACSPRSPAPPNAGGWTQNCLRLARGLDVDGERGVCRRADDRAGRGRDARPAGRWATAAG